MSKALELINEIYNTEELEKAAQYQQEFAEVEDVLDKVASLAGADLSGLNDSDKLELWNALVNQYNAQEGQGEQLAQNQQAGEAQEQSQVGATSPAQQVEKAQDFQMKVAELFTPVICGRLTTLSVLLSTWLRLRRVWSRLFGQVYSRS